MKITLIHGEDSEASSSYLKGTIESFRKRGLKLRKISDSSLSLSESLSVGDLFGQSEAYLLENPTKITPKEVEWISKKSKAYQGYLIIYHESELPISSLKAFSEISEVKEFKLPKIIYSFLESFAPSKAGQALKLLHELIKRQPSEYIFAVLAKHVRDLYWVKIESGSLDYPDWRISKLKRQAEAFSEEKLKKIINALARIDVSSKTSKQELGSLLDLLIASQLQ